MRDAHSPYGSNTCQIADLNLFTGARYLIYNEHFYIKLYIKKGEHIMRRQITALSIDLIFIIAFVVLCASKSWAEPMSQVAINGQVLTTVQVQQLEGSIGSRIEPGAYLVNAHGCWVNLTTGRGGCLDSISTFSRYGSGERTSDGSWNHYSNSAGMGVGGTSDGCIYTTTGWSNC